VQAREHELALRDLSATPGARLIFPTLLWEALLGREDTWELMSVGGSVHCMAAAYRANMLEESLSILSRPRALPTAEVLATLTLAAFTTPVFAVELCATLLLSSRISSLTNLYKKSNF
jgi:hypothetical protein